MLDVRELLGDDYIAHFFNTHVIPQKFRSDKPDGIYDREKGHCRWRDVIVEGCTLITISKMWLDKGGPVDLPAELRESWGSYLK